MRFLRAHQVLEMIGVSRSTLWRMVQAGAFPQPVRITVGTSGYLLEAVESWMKAKADGLPWSPSPAAATSSGPFLRGERWPRLESHGAKAESRVVSAR